MKTVVTKSHHKNEWKTNKPIWILLFTVTLASLAAIPIIFDSFTTPKILTLATGLICLSAVLLRNRKYELNFLGRFEKFLVIFYVFALTVATFFSDIPFQRAFLGQFGRGNGYGYYILTLMLFVATYSLWRKEYDHLISSFLQKFSWVIALYAVLQSWGIDFAQIDTTKSRILLTLGNSNFSGALLSIFFTYNIVLLAKSKSKKFSELLLVSILFYATIICAAIQGIFIALLALVVSLNLLVKGKFPKFSYKLFLLQIFLFLLTLLFALVSKGPLDFLLNRPTLKIRFEYWKIGLNMLKDNLLFGVGPDAFYDYSSQYMAPGTIELITYTRIDAAHNWFINLAANFGLLTLLPILILFIFIALKNLRLILSPEVEPYFLATSLTFLMLLLDAMFSIEQPGLGIWLYFFAGLSLAMVTANGQLSTTAAKRNVLTRNIMISAMLVVTLFSTSVYFNRIYHDLEFRNNIRNYVIGNMNSNTSAKIVEFSLNLRSEPEYTSQAISALAKIGYAPGMDTVSKASYDYNSNSIQSLLIRQEVLRVLNRQTEACPIVEKLVSKEPWELIHWENHLICAETTSDTVKNQQLALLTLPYILIRLKNADSKSAEFTTLFFLATLTYYATGDYSTAKQYAAQSLLVAKENMLNPTEGYIAQSEEIFNSRQKLLLGRIQMLLSAPN
jgi:O-antigen ligase